MAMSGESNRVDEFVPLPDLGSSLIPPAGTPVPEKVGDGRTAGDFFFAGTREGSSGIDDGGAQGRGICDDDVGSQGLRSAVEDDGAQDGGCGVGGYGDGDLESGTDLDQGADLEGGIASGSGVDHAGGRKPAGYKKRFKCREGPDVRVGPPREIGAVELALRNASTRTTNYILEPVVGTSFDSLAEAYEFYNLYSWEAGFGIRYGNSYTNGKGYRSTQELVCQMEDDIKGRFENTCIRWKWRAKQETLCTKRCLTICRTIGSILYMQVYFGKTTAWVVLHLHYARCGSTE